MSLEVCRSVAEFREACDDARRRGHHLGLVPTMGALHAGHMALVRAARDRASVVAVTIFVNPTQFGPNEDLDKYPRDFDGDLAKCRAEGAALVFAPAASEMYPEGERTRVRVSHLTDHLCGASRPGHFEGVATVVTKLLAVAGPCVAVFGRKDYQQLKVIERMTRDLLLPVEIVGHPIVREPDGLALSSRNSYLSPADRTRALAIPRALSAAVRAFDGGERRAGALRAAVVEALGDLRIDYAAVADAAEFSPFADDRHARRACAARRGRARRRDAPDRQRRARRGPAADPMTARGRFIVLEGIDGCGSTTQARRLAAALGAQLTAEPTNGPVGALIREILRGRGERPFAATTMALLFAADRLDHVDREIEPALAAGTSVVSDRYDLSSLAYQSATADAGDAALPWIRELNRHALRPDLTLVIDVEASVAAARRRARGAAAELYEVDELQRRLAGVYRDAARLVPGDRVLYIDGSPDADAVFERVLEAARA